MRALHWQNDSSDRNLLERSLRCGKRLRCSVEAHYEVGELLGQGKYARVYGGKCRVTGEEFALKRIKKTSNCLDDIEKEISLCTSLAHPYCLQLHEAFETAEEVTLVLDRARGGDLFERILQRNKAKNKFTEAQAARILRRVVTAVRYLHSKGILHRDIKPENLLIMDDGDDTQVQLADFNLSKIMEGSHTQTFLGTMGYIAPEVLNQKPYSYSADAWSLGICLFILLGGYPPFPLGDNPMGPVKVRQGKYSFAEKHWGHISPEAKDCIRCLLKLRPEERITLDELSQHPWLMVHAPPEELADAEEPELDAKPEALDSRTSSSSSNLGGSYSSLKQELTALLDAGSDAVEDESPNACDVCSTSTAVQ